MNTGVSPAVVEVNPSAAWDILGNDADARLIDVRSRPEWGFVGGPDLSEIGHSVICAEWKTFPGMVLNPDFPGHVLEALFGHTPSTALFMCRSGVRSMHAAQMMSEVFAAHGKMVSCISIAEGFEGDLDPKAHRGGLNGWKARGLAWCQT